MSQLNSTTNPLNRQRGKHLTKFDRGIIALMHKAGESLRSIAKALNCSPTTVSNELKRGTKPMISKRGRKPTYNCKFAQKAYEENRKRCHRKYKISNESPFVKWVLTQFIVNNWSLDACVGYAKEHKLFDSSEMVCTKTLYNAVYSGRLSITPIDLPEAITRAKKKNTVRKHKRCLGQSIDKRPSIVSERVEFGHWEIDTVIGKKSGKGAVVLTLVEKLTQQYMAIKLASKESHCVLQALLDLREEYGETKFNSVFKSITADNGSEFSTLHEISQYGVDVYFAHPYSSWERAQNERHNRLLRMYLPKGKSIDSYTQEEIEFFADKINFLPRRALGYNLPDELFNTYLDRIYSLT